MKRPISPENSPICNRTRSKKRKLNEEKNIKWISATKTRNYLINDALVDWLKFYGNRDRSSSDFSNQNTFSNFILQKGIEFEKRIIELIKTRFEVKFVSEFYSADKIKETIKYMKKGVPIIYSAPISNKLSKTYGIIDILIRSDYINKLVNENYLTPEEEKIPSPKLKTKFHYLVIDIKFSSINLCSNGINILNSGNNLAYKAQLYIYNQAISEIQGYNPNKSYILGRRWNFSSKGVSYKGNNCFEKLGVVDFNGKDSFVKEKTVEAINWYRDVMENGVFWKLYPPSRPELYPNMCVDSDNFNSTKKKIAEKLGEISMLWQCGIKNRNNSLNNNVKSWKDENCNSKTLGINGKYADVIDQIIKINNQNENLILPKKIKNNIGDWKNYKKNEIFVDFETFSDLCLPFENLPEQKEFSMIFLIGVGRIVNENWEYKYFICNKPTLDEEFRIITEFVTYVNELGNPPIFYWHAENLLWNKMTEKHFNRKDLDENNKMDIIYNWDIKNWIDICNIFKIEPITIKGCFNFGLKNVAKAMRSNNLISTKIESDCKNGIIAMVKAWKCYEETDNPINSTIMKDIIKYNEFDCKVLYDILNYIRKNNI